MPSRGVRLLTAAVKKKLSESSHAAEESVADATTKKDSLHPWWAPKEVQAREVATQLSQEDSLSATLTFITKQNQYAIPQVPISIKAYLRPDDLNSLIKSFIKKGGMVTDVPTFEFLIGGQLLIGSVGEHLRILNISLEATTEVEYFERYPPPTPKDYLEHDDWVASVMSCGDWLLTGCYDNTVQLWHVEPKKKALYKDAHRLTVPAHKAPVKAVAWIHTNKIAKTFVSCSIDQTAIVWEWNSKDNTIQYLWECRGHCQSIECLAVYPNDSMFATGSWDNTVKIWSADAETKSETNHTTEEPDPKKAKKSKKEKLKTPLMTLGGHSESVSGVEWLASTQLLSCSWDHSMRLWDLEMTGMVSQIAGNVPFLCLSYSKLNRSVLAGCSDRNIRLYDPRTNQGSVVKSKFENHSKWVSSVKWSPSDENLFVSGSYDSTVRVWDRRSPRAPSYNLEGHEEKVLSVDWSCPSHIVSGSADCTAQLYNT